MSRKTLAEIVEEERMSSKIKLGSEIEFDSVTEKDIIYTVTELKKHKQLKNYIQACIRVAANHPQVGAEVNRLCGLEYTNNRDRFFRELREEMVPYEQKVDMLLEGLMELKAELKVMATYGLIDKVNNLEVQALGMELFGRNLKTKMGSLAVHKNYVEGSKIDIAADMVAERVSTMLQRVDVEGILNNARQSYVTQQNATIPVERVEGFKPAQNGTQNVIMDSSIQEVKEEVKVEETPVIEEEAQVEEDFVTEDMMDMLGDANIFG